MSLFLFFFADVDLSCNRQYCFKIAAESVVREGPVFDWLTPLRRRVEWGRGGAGGH